MLTSNQENKALLNSFISKKENNTLEAYIKDEDKAWTEDLDGETRVYLVKNKSGEIALFFSLKCGLLVGRDLEIQLTDDESEFINTVIDVKLSKDEDGTKRLYDAGIAIYGEKVDQLFDIAFRRIDTKNESKEIKQSDKTINVPICLSAIELRHLCKNESFSVPDDIGVPLGFGIFWEIIVPIIIDVTSKVGCKYIYLFAADNTKNQDDPEMRTLISYYKTNYKFSECDEGLKFVKPEYDNYCYGLIQNVSKLKDNREAIWQEFSDI